MPAHQDDLLQQQRNVGRLDPEFEDPPCCLAADDGITDVLERLPGCIQAGGGERPGFLKVPHFLPGPKMSSSPKKHGLPGVGRAVWAAVRRLLRIPQTPFYWRLRCVREAAAGEEGLLPPVLVPSQP